MNKKHWLLVVVSLFVALLGGILITTAHSETEETPNAEVISKWDDLEEGIHIEKIVRKETVIKQYTKDNGSAYSKTHNFVYTDGGNSFEVTKAEYKLLQVGDTLGIGEDINGNAILEEINVWDKIKRRVNE